MIVSHNIGIGSDADRLRCDRIANVCSRIANVGSRIINVRLGNGKVTDRIAIVISVLAVRSPVIHQSSLNLYCGGFLSRFLLAPTVETRGLPRTTAICCEDQSAKPFSSRLSPYHLPSAQLNTAQSADR
jgi:hypothetical protein